MTDEEDKPERHPFEVRCDQIERAVVQWFEEEMGAEVEYEGWRVSWVTTINGVEIDLTHLAAHINIALVPPDQLLVPLPKPDRLRKPMDPEE